ncbi:ankyrin repeat-containing domain protein [Baffinella frigidus]|nr:ankyrin repeat-containing domain protein [Cryptophyta sp. CCMP2293]
MATRLALVLFVVSCSGANFAADHVAPTLQQHCAFCASQYPASSRCLRMGRLRGGSGEAGGRGTVLTADGLITPGLDPVGEDGAAAMRDEQGGVGDQAEEGVVKVAKGDLCLWEAAKSGDDETIQELLRTGGAEVESRDPREGGWTALHHAARGGKGRSAAMLLRFGAAVDARNDKDATPLALAAAEGHLAMIQKLVASGAEVDAGNVYGSTPLHRAAASGCTKTCSLLVKLGADVNASNSLGVTALHMASDGCHIDTVEELLSLGADVHAENTDGWTALHCAAQEGSVELIETLLHKGAKASVLTRLHESPADKAARFGHDKASTLLAKALWNEDPGEYQFDVPKRDPGELEEEFKEFWVAGEEKPAEDLFPDLAGKAGRQARNYDGPTLWKSEVGQAGAGALDDDSESEGGKRGGDQRGQDMAGEVVDPDEMERDRKEWLAGVDELLDFNETEPLGMLAQHVRDKVERTFAEFGVVDSEEDDGRGAEGDGMPDSAEM